MKELVINERRPAWSRLAPRALAVCLSCLIGLLAAPVVAEGQEASQILIKNVRIFDGKEAKLSFATDVWIVGNKIERISTTAASSADANVEVVDGAGRVLMPGLIESHTHLTWAARSSGSSARSMKALCQVHEFIPPVRSFPKPADMGTSANKTI